jgi:hypothetical protein
MSGQYVETAVVFRFLPGEWGEGATPERVQATAEIMVITALSFACGHFAAFRDYAVHSALDPVDGDMGDLDARRRFLALRPDHLQSVLEALDPERAAT